MKKIIAINLVIVVLIVAVILFPEPKTTGFAVKDAIVEGYIMNVNMKSDDKQLGSSGVQSMKVFFSDSSINTDDLVFSRSEEFSYDADKEGSLCSNRTYLVEEWFDDSNGNNVKDGGEAVAFSSSTDSDGCLGIILPSEDFTPVAKVSV